MTICPEEYAWNQCVGLSIPLVDELEIPTLEVTSAATQSVVVVKVLGSPEVANAVPDASLLPGGGLIDHYIPLFAIRRVDQRTSLAYGC